MEISVVIPTFNREPLLRRALDSVFRQSLRPVEVIVVDDGSVDPTAETVSRSYPQARYIRQPNGGVSRARNAGIQNSTAEWVALLDSDDEWLPAKLEAQSRALELGPKHRVCHTDEIWVRNGVRVNPMRKHRKCGGWIYQNCLPLCAISPSSVLIHRSVFHEVGYFDEQLPACEDYDLWLRICAVYPVLYVDEPLITKYGGHPDQLSKRHWGMDRFRVKAMEKMLMSGGLNDRDRAATLVALVRRLSIVLSGAHKRNNTALIEEYSGKIERYRRLAARPARRRQ